MLSPPRGPSLEEPSLVSGDDPAAVCSTVADTTEQRPSFTSAGHDLASPAGTVEPSCLSAQREPNQLPTRVTNTILEARAPSTRRLYALKWSVFSDWCSARTQDPTSCDVSHVLTFLQELLDKGHTPSMLKVYVAAIAANHSLEAGRTIGRNDLVIKFLRGALRNFIKQLKGHDAQNSSAYGPSIHQASRWLASPVCQCFLSWVWTQWL